MLGAKVPALRQQLAEDGSDAGGVGVPGWDQGPMPYKVRCIFCHRDHEGEYWDDLDAEILRCRDAAPYWRRGDLASYEELSTRPITPETCALRGD